MTFEELLAGHRGETPKDRQSDEPRSGSHGDDSPGRGRLLEAVLERGNLLLALKRVKRNRGSAGADGMSVDDLLPWLTENWASTRAALLAGQYRPAPVKRQAIPKPGGGVRELGIPTVLDRLIQQAILQVLQPLFDPTFSDSSYGFRPKRSAHDAVRRAVAHIQSGRRVVVDVDLEKFFDRVNHDVLMDRLGKRIADARLLRLIRRYLESGVMVHGVVIERFEGTPQGGPLSPLLANVLLDDVDKELERRGHCFVRYADDGQVYVRSKRAGERVRALLVRLFGRLRLRVNEAKSAVASVFSRDFLGFGFWVGPGGEVRLRVSRKSLGRMKERVRELTLRRRGRSLGQVARDLRSYLLGWGGYFRLAPTPGVFADLDGWVRRRLRALQLRQWKRGPTVFRELRSLGASVDLAAEIARGTRRWWWNASKRLHHVLTNAWVASLGVPSLAALASSR